MRVMFDTNILISAGLFGSSRLAALAGRIADEHTLVLSSRIIEELHRVVNLKFPSRKGVLEDFLCSLSYEIAYTPDLIDSSRYPKIRDEHDYPILASAIIADVDVFITGDKDFDNLGLEHPEILTMTAFSEKYL